MIVVQIVVNAKYTKAVFFVNNILTVLSTSLGKTFLAWRFILNENILF